MWILGVGLVIVCVAYGIRQQVSPLANPTVGGRPVIWWHVDDSQANTKEWLSFEDRATREPNSPYLRLCLRRARELWSTDFEIIPLIGRKAALARLNNPPVDCDRCPPALWMAWCQSAFLSEHGGLWMDGSVLPIGANLRARLTEPVMTFGSDPDEDLVATEQNDRGSAAAGRSVGWSQAPGHPMWNGLARDMAETIELGAQSWSAFEGRRGLRFLWDKHCSGVTRVDRKAEVSRDRFGKQLGYEDLFDLSEWPTGSMEGGLWVPLPFGRDGLERASPWLWFTRMSELQIMESEFLWAKLALA